MNSFTSASGKTTVPMSRPSHGNAVLAGDAALEQYHGLSDFRYGRYQADVLRYVHRADFGLYVLSVEQGMTLGVETDLDFVEVCDEQVFEKFTLLEVTLLHGVVRQGAIHGAGVDVRQAIFAGQSAGDGALSRAGYAVYGDDGFSVQDVSCFFEGNKCTKKRRSPVGFFR